MTRYQDTTNLPDRARKRSALTYTDDPLYSFRSRSQHTRRGAPNSNDTLTYGRQNGYEESINSALGLNRDYYENHPADPTPGRKPKRRPYHGRRYHIDATSERLPALDRNITAVDDDFGIAARTDSNPDYYRWGGARSQPPRRELNEDQRDDRRRRGRENHERRCSRGHSRGRSRGHSRVRSRSYSRGLSRSYPRDLSRSYSRGHSRGYSRGRSRGSRDRSRGRSRGPLPKPYFRLRSHREPGPSPWLTCTAGIAGAALAAAAMEAYRARHEAGTWRTGPRATRIGSAAAAAAAVAAGGAIATAAVDASFGRTVEQGQPAHSNQQEEPLIGGEK